MHRINQPDTGYGFHPQQEGVSSSGAAAIGCGENPHKASNLKLNPIKAMNESGSDLANYWDSLAIELVEDDDNLVGNLKKVYPNDIYECAYQVLRKWREFCPRRFSVENLAKNLRAPGLKKNSDAGKIEKNYAAYRGEVIYPPTGPVQEMPSISKLVNDLEPINARVLWFARQFLQEHQVDELDKTHKDFGDKMHAALVTWKETSPDTYNFQALLQALKNRMVFGGGSLAKKLENKYSNQPTKGITVLTAEDRQLSAETKSQVMQEGMQAKKRVEAQITAGSDGGAAASQTVNIHSLISSGIFEKFKGTCDHECYILTRVFNTPIDRTSSLAEQWGDNYGKIVFYFFDDWIKENPSATYEQMAQIIEKGYSKQNNKARGKYISDLIRAVPNKP